MTGPITVTGWQGWVNIQYTCTYLPPHVHTYGILRSSHGDSWNLESVFYSREPIHTQWEALNGEWLCMRHEKRHKTTYIKGGHRHWRKTRPQYKTHQRQNPPNLGIPTLCFFKSCIIIYYKASYYDLWSSQYRNLPIPVHTLEWICKLGLP
jgi:hypothetical protein